MIGKILNQASEFIKSEFNLELQKSKLKIYSSDDWGIFCKTNNFNEKAEGLYIPKSFSAYVKLVSPVFISNISADIHTINVIGNGISARELNAIAAIAIEFAV